MRGLLAVGGEGAWAAEDRPAEPGSAGRGCKDPGYGQGCADGP